MPVQSPGLYVHIPFCRSRCPYCAFASGIYDTDLADKYLAAITRELSLRGTFRNDTPSSLFIGGGTPSCLGPKQLEKLLYILQFSTPVSEATCELNPDSTDADKLRLLLNGGVNRCSFGVQTFSEKGLRLLGRRHDGASARRAVELALKLGFPEVSLDLITAWPGQNERELLEDLQQAADLGVTHLSCYQLAMEEGSVFRRQLLGNKLEEKDDDETRRFWDLTESRLVQLGFWHYETSNYCRPGHACRHNVAIWKGGEYLGVGAAAHSHLGGRRFANVINTREYIATIEEGRLPEAFSETLDPEAKARESAVFWLRLFEGIDLAEFRERTGFNFQELYAEVLPGLVERGLLVLADAGGRIRVAKEHQPILDAILVELV